MKASFVLFCLFQTEKPERRHTFASLALRKRYSYLTDPSASEFAIFTYMTYELILDTNVILISLVKRSLYTVCKYTYIPYFFLFSKICSSVNLFYSPATNILIICQSPNICMISCVLSFAYPPHVVKYTPCFMLFYICENSGNQCLSVHSSFEHKMFQLMSNKNFLLNCSYSFTGHFTLIGFMIVCGCVY